MDIIKRSIMEVLYDQRPMTVRQVFYQLVGRGVIAKTEAEYKRTVVRLLGQMRLDRTIPFSWIADNTRWQRKPTTFGSASEGLEHTRAFYRQALWRDQDHYVEVWLEKEALAGVLLTVTSEYDVPLMVTRGYPSLSFLYSAAATIESIDRPTTIYYLGDLDPSGLDIARNVEDRLTEFAPDADILFDRIAVSREQVEALVLPTRPTKTSDSRSAGFSGESVEVDAIPASTLRSMVREAIEILLPDGALGSIAVAEDSERAILDNIIATMAAR